jgi:hypothetical protein
MHRIPTYHSHQHAVNPPPDSISVRNPDMMAKRHPAFLTMSPPGKIQKKSRPRSKLPRLLSPIEVDAIPFGKRRAASCSCTRYRCSEMDDETPTGAKRLYCGYYGCILGLTRDGNPQRDAECLRMKGK